MPLPSPFRRLTATTSTVDDLSAELGRLDRVRLDAQNALHDLGAKRPALLIDGSDAQIAKLDADLAMHRRTLEQAEARIAVVEPEWRAADQRETAAKLDHERRDRYTAALKARAEGVKILAAYTAEAAALAGKLRRLAEIEGQIAEANADLPSDVAPIGSAEPFNGRMATPDVWPEVVEWIDRDGNSRGVAEPGQAQPAPGYTRRTRYGYTSIPGAPGFPHRPLGDRVALPAIDPGAPSYWAPGTVSPRRSAEAEAFLLQRGVRP